MQKICIDKQDCINEIETIFKKSISSLEKYLYTHIDELISLTKYNQSNKIYDLVIDNEFNQKQKLEERIEDIATKLIIESTTNLTPEEAVKKATDIVLNIMNDKENPKLYTSNSNQSLNKLLSELIKFKNERIIKIPKYYKLQFIKSKDWELGLKESPYRQIYYNIPNIIKSLFIFIILTIFSLILIRIINRNIFNN